MKVRFKEKSLIARIGGTLLGEKCIAVTIGNTIHLWNASTEDIIKNKKWLQHEFVHIQQLNLSNMALGNFFYCIYGSL